MPQQSKARWARLKVGVMAMVALIILSVLLFLLTGSQRPFASRTTLYTYMEDSSALTENSAVRLNGIVIGKVSKIELSGLPDPKRVIRMDLKIEDAYLRDVPVDSVASIGAENMLGTKYVNLKKGVSKATVKAGGEILSKDVSDFNDIIDQGNTLLAQLQSILKRVDAVVGQVEVGKGSLGKLLVDEELYNHLNQTASEAQKLIAALNSDKSTVGKLVHSDEMYNDVRGSMARLDNVLEGVQQGQGTVGHLLKDPTLYNELNKTIADVRKLLADLDAGKGSAGKLLKSDELHNQIATTLRKLDTTIDKVNSGQGTLGQLMVNPALYESLTGSTRELQGLLKDFRGNPKKFLSIKLGLF
jgi:phospholipid/cholesterol/gamma-HCH transport system substrate-binding protein